MTEDEGAGPAVGQGGCFGGEKSRSSNDIPEDTVRKSSLEDGSVSSGYGVGETRTSVSELSGLSFPEEVASGQKEAGRPALGLLRFVLVASPLITRPISGN